MKYLPIHFKNLHAALGKNIFLCSDFDGTLAPIVKDPNRARISARTRKIILELSSVLQGHVAIVSGRAISDLMEKVGVKDLIYVGNHGLEISGKGINFRRSFKEGYKKALREMKEYLREALGSVNGVVVEDKGFGLSIHYRMVNSKERGLVKEAFSKMINLAIFKGKTLPREGKMVFEIRPLVKWDKGSAVKWLLSRVKKEKTGGVWPIYIGDDLTDEDAFRAIGGKGLTIHVGNREDVSAAEYYVKDPSEVVDFLRKLLEIRKTAI